MTIQKLICEVTAEYSCMLLYYVAKNEVTSLSNYNLLQIYHSLYVFKTL